MVNCRPSKTVYIAYNVDNDNVSTDHRIGTIDLDTGIITPTCAKHEFHMYAIEMGTDAKMWIESTLLPLSFANELHRVDDRPCTI